MAVKESDMQQLSDYHLKISDPERSVMLVTNLVTLGATAQDFSGARLLKSSIEVQLSKTLTNS